MPSNFERLKCGKPTTRDDTDCQRRARAKRRKTATTAATTTTATTTATTLSWSGKKTKATATTHDTVDGLFVDIAGPLELSEADVVVGELAPQPAHFVGEPGEAAADDGVDLQNSKPHHRVK